MRQKTPAACRRVDSGTNLCECNEHRVSESLRGEREERKTSAKVQRTPSKRSLRGEREERKTSASTEEEGNGEFRMKSIEEYVISIPDFPEEGIIFRDVTGVLQDAEGLHLAIDLMQEKLQGLDFDVIAGPEARGFIFAMPLAYNLKKSLAAVRKKGKLPRETISAEYELEYGTAEVEMHIDAIKPGQKVVIVDDLMATGGTLEAIIKMVEELGGEVVKIVCLMELAGLKGREKLAGYDVDSVIIYPGK